MERRMEDTKQVKNILVIGNGFDLYHCLPTRYIDFINVGKRLFELAAEKNLSKCLYVKYMFGPNSPLYSDEYIEKCYRIHKNRMQKVELDQSRIKDLVECCSRNVWIDYFLKICLRNIGWIDFEKEMAQVINAITNYFDCVTNNENEYLKEGVPFDENVLSRSDVYILMQVPFYEEQNERLKIKDDYFVKDLKNKIILKVDENKIIKKLEQDLEDLSEALCIYLEQFVQSIAIDKRANNLLFYHIDQVINFNYTDTYARLYSKDIQTFYVHGSMNETKNGIVLGINADEKDQKENMDLRFVKFKKYYQCIQKGTSFCLKKMMNENCKNNLHIVGHSLDITDRDILADLITFKNTVTTIYFHSKEAKNEQIAKLILLFGKNKLDELLADEKIVFQELEEFKPADLEDEELRDEEDEFYAYKFKHKCRIIKRNPYDGIVLCGNERVKVAVREEWSLGNWELEIVDYFISRVEYFNHSGYYNGIVVLDEIFNENRYCSATAYIRYLLPVGEKQDISENQLAQLLDTEFQFIPLTIQMIGVEFF